MGDLATDLAEDLATDLAVDLAGSAAAPADWRFSGDYQASWRYGYGETLVGGALDAWTDYIPQANKELSEAQYVVTAPSVPLRPVDGTDGWDMSSGVVQGVANSDQFEENKTWTVAIALQVLTTGVTSYPWVVSDGPNVAAPYQALQLGAGNNYNARRSPSTHQSINGGGPVMTNEYMVCTMVYTGSLLLFYRDLTLVGSTSSPLTMGTAQALLSIGAIGGGSQPFPGKVLEMIMSVSVKDATEVATLVGNLEADHGF